jgi:hypothetical protein
MNIENAKLTAKSFSTHMDRTYLLQIQEISIYQQFIILNNYTNIKFSLVIASTASSGRGRTLHAISDFSI